MPCCPALLRGGDRSTLGLGASVRFGQATLAQLAVAGMTPQATRAPPPPSAAGMSE